MKNKCMKKSVGAALAVLTALSLAACGGSTAQAASEQVVSATESNSSSPAVAAAVSTASSAIDTADLFTDRDLRQSADLSGAETITLTDGQVVTITEEGVYVLTGTASDAEVIVDSTDDAKVQIVLDGVQVTNSSLPCIYVKNADKVFVTTTDSDNSLSVTGTFEADDDTNTDAVIFSKDDLVLNGTGTLAITSSDNGITSKDDLKITGGQVTINCQSDAIEANDSIAIADGSVTITTPKDGLHAENDEDETVGYVYICGGSLNITAGDDAIHATTILQIDGGAITISAAEGLEATWIQINDGTIDITSSDDGINAGKKSSICIPTVEINGGSLTIDMGAGDTDAVDSNGYIYINGGTVNITAQSPFDYDGAAELNGGTVIVNGSEVTTLTNQMMGGGKGGGMGQTPFADPGTGGQNGQEGQYGPGGGSGGPGGGFGGPGGYGHGYNT